MCAITAARGALCPHRLPHAGHSPALNCASISMSLHIVAPVEKACYAKKAGKKIQIGKMSKK
jgi:hypothetical protein